MLLQIKVCVGHSKPACTQTHTRTHTHTHTQCETWHLPAQVLRAGYMARAAPLLEAVDKDRDLNSPEGKTLHVRPMNCLQPQMKQR